MKEKQNYNITMDLGKDHRRLLISQKERQLDLMVPSGESTQYYSWSIVGKKQLNLNQIKSLDQTPIYGVGEELERCLNNNPDWGKL